MSHSYYKIAFGGYMITKDNEPLWEVRTLKQAREDVRELNITTAAKKDRELTRLAKEFTRAAMAGDFEVAEKIDKQLKDLFSKVKEAAE